MVNQYSRLMNIRYMNNSGITHMHDASTLMVTNETDKSEMTSFKSGIMQKLKTVLRYL